MSKRTSILKALAEKLKVLDGTQYKSNIFGNSYSKLKFWDECNDFPAIYMSPGTELREYLPGNFTWAHLAVSVKLYCKSEDAQDQLEQLIDDVEKVIDANRVMVFNDSNQETTEILVTSITTDEGLLAPYAVGEINLQIRYQLM